MVAVVQAMVTVPLDSAARAKSTIVEPISISAISVPVDTESCVGVPLPHTATPIPKEPVGIEEIVSVLVLGTRPRTSSSNPVVLLYGSEVSVPSKSTANPAVSVHLPACVTCIARELPVLGANRYQMETT